MSHSYRASEIASFYIQLFNSIPEITSVPTAWDSIEVEMKRWEIWEAFWKTIGN